MGPGVATMGRTVAHAPVLIVDDNESVRDSLAEWLQLEGFEVATAVHGGDALDKLRHGLRPRLILLDLMMPVMDGWDFRSQQMGDRDLRAIPVIILSATGFSARTVKAQFPGAEYIAKPVEADTLLQVIKRTCAGQAS